MINDYIFQGALSFVSRSSRTSQRRPVLLYSPSSGLQGDDYHQKRSLFRTGIISECFVEGKRWPLYTVPAKILLCAIMVSWVYLSVQLHNSKTLWCKNAVPAKPSFVQTWHFLYSHCHLVTDFCKFGMCSVWWIVPVKRSLDPEDAEFTFSFSGFAISLPSGIYKELLRWLQSLFYHHNHHQISNLNSFSIEQY